VHPLAGYASIVAVFNLLFAGFLAVLGFRKQPLPERIGWGDILLLGLGTYRLSRLLAKDSVTSFLRAPFTQFEKATGGGEVEESPRGTGLRHAIGELVTCPFCLGQWVAAFFLYGLVLAPRLTRLIASVYAVLTLSDALQLARDRAKSAASGG
jgi:hypothetical protein